MLVRSHKRKEGGEGLKKHPIMLQDSRIKRLGRAKNESGGNFCGREMGTMKIIL